MNDQTSFEFPSNDTALSALMDGAMLVVCTLVVLRVVQAFVA